MRLQRLWNVVAVGVAAVVAAAACSSNDRPAPGGTGTLTKVTVVTGLQFYGQTGYMFDGIAKGFFRDEGLDVTIQGGNGTEPNLQLLQQGTVQFAEVDTTGAMIAWGEGRFRDWKLIASVEQQTVVCFTAFPGKGITASPRSLEGKKIGYIAGGVNYLLAPGYEQAAAVDGSKIDWIPVKDLVGALLSGQVDSVTYYINATGAIIGAEVGAAKKARRAPRLPLVNLPYSTYLADLLGNGIVVSDSYAQAHPDIVKAFSRAIIKSLRFAYANPDETGRIFYAKHPEYPGGVDGAASEIKGMIPYGSVGNTPVGLIDKNRFARAIAALEGMDPGANHQQFLSGGPSPDSMVAFNLMPTS